MIKEKNTIIRLLTALFPDAKIYLFGSRARGDNKTTSDIDLAIDSKTPLSSLDLIKAKNIIEALNIPQGIDIVDLNKISDEMKSIILSEGVLWKI